MFRLFKNKKIEGTTLELKIRGMHCSSCSMNIDGELEDLMGILEVKTSYAKQKTIIIFDHTKVDEIQIKKKIEGLGYKVL
ncbi:MAG: heavy-metal-associated domain-containing protein [Pseudomonadales bacterium]|nr:heavy-metal-associated domain-containing protein [Pseudomonadales bacterium]